MVFGDSDDDDLDAPRFRPTQIRAIASIAKQADKYLTEVSELSSDALRDTEPPRRTVQHSSRGTKKQPRPVPTAAESDSYDSANEELKRLELELDEEEEPKAKARPKSELKTRRAATKQLLDVIDEESAPAPKLSATKPRPVLDAMALPESVKE